MKKLIFPLTVYRDIILKILNGNYTLAISDFKRLKNQRTAINTKSPYIVFIQNGSRSNDWEVNECCSLMHYLTQATGVQ